MTQPEHMTDEIYETVLSYKEEGERRKPRTA